MIRYEATTPAPSGQPRPSAHAVRLGRRITGLEPQSFVPIGVKRREGIHHEDAKIAKKNDEPAHDRSSTRFIRPSLIPGTFPFTGKPIR